MKLKLTLRQLVKLIGIPFFVSFCIALFYNIVSWLYLIFVIVPERF